MSGFDAMTDADVAEVYDACEVERAATARLVAQLRSSGRQSRRWCAETIALHGSHPLLWYREASAAVYDRAASALEEAR